ncbi:hypothetical protein [Pseudofulvibacter geojedonensis]|uniref:Lipoprotein n=1 Tax=Pseudofulvibacter geojedonensis TaxID=1123758 RepID=A0ABW3I2Y9_9FLAO
MKTLKLLFLLSFLLISCNNKQKQATKKTAEINTTKEIRNIDTHGLDLINKISGKYFILTEENNTIYYKEKCQYTPYDIEVVRKVEDINDYWLLNWQGETYEINHIEEKNNDIYLTSDENDFTFIFIKKAKSWYFAELGMKGLYPISKIENIKKYKSIACTRAKEITKTLPLNWTELTNIDGNEVVYVPCEEAISGIDLNYSEEGNTIDFRSGSDPLQIISTSKLYNKITITYEYSDGNKNSIVIHDFQGNTIKIGKGNSQDNKYINKENETQYSIVKEDCD